MFSVLVALLEHTKVLTEDEAKHFIKRLNESVQPTNYDDAKRLIAEIAGELELKETKSPKK